MEEVLSDSQKAVRTSGAEVKPERSKGGTRVTPAAPPGPGAPLTEQEAERGPAGREGAQQVGQAGPGAAHEAAVVGGALAAAQLLQPPPLRRVAGAVRQGPQQRLRPETGVARRPRSVVTAAECPLDPLGRCPSATRKWMLLSALGKRGSPGPLRPCPGEGTPLIVPSAVAFPTPHAHLSVTRLSSKSTSGVPE